MSEAGSFTDSVQELVLYDAVVDAVGGEAEGLPTVADHPHLGVTPTAADHADVVSLK